MTRTDVGSGRRTAAAFLTFAISFCLAALIAVPASSHDATFPLKGKKLTVKADKGKKKRSFSMKAQSDLVRASNFDPADGASLVINSLGKNASSTGLIDLPIEKWSEVRDKDDRLIGWKYKDGDGENGGVTKVLVKNGSISVKAKGKNWSWKPQGKNKSVWAHFYAEEEEFCANFSKSTSSKVSKNKTGLFVASNAKAPIECPEQTCGNGRVELGEACDDGNLDETDGCNNDCTIGVCEGEEFASTYEAIQNVVFDSPVYGCTNGACHDAASPAGELDLTAGASYDNLVGVMSEASPNLPRVQIGDITQSVLYEKLLAKFEERASNVGGSPMPTAAPAVTEAILEGIAEWIRTGASPDASVLGTQDNFGTCLPEPEPLKITPPVPPAAGEGIQFLQTPWPLPGESEDEVCMTTFYDFTATNLVPDGAKQACSDFFSHKRTRCTENNARCDSDEECPGDDNFCRTPQGFTNTTDECFLYDDQLLLQDPQSHHSIIHVYKGKFDETHPSWGNWTYKFDDPADPRNGQACDPADVDPNLGFNPGCSGEAESSIACVGYGPPDNTALNLGGGSGGTLPSFSGSQETYYSLKYPDGVFNELPMRAIIVWNSHAFNLTKIDSTMSQYLNMEFAKEEEGDQLYPAQSVFDARYIFGQQVPPFGTQELCATSTLPQGARFFQMSSHMHERGVLWRTWAPPNTPCRPDCQSDVIGGFGCEKPAGLPICAGPPDGIDPMYTSTVYNDPLQLDFEIPIPLDSPNVEDRTYLWCALFDNGSTPGSPPVKQHSTSPGTPPIFGTDGELIGLGGPCDLDERACMEGPNKGQLCDKSETGISEARFCETSDGADDGVCDACPLRGGVTTGDEMFLNLGTYYVLPLDE